MTQSKITQSEINTILWKACDTFRGTVDASEYKNYILVMLFLKYVSDTWKEKYELLQKELNDPELVKRKLSRERFILEDHCSFDYLFANRNNDKIGDLINIALEKIESSNKKLEGVFRNIDYNSESNLGQTKDRNARLKNLLEDFNDARLNLRPSNIGSLDVIGNAYEFLISKFAAGAGKKAGEFYTPPEISTLMSYLVEPKAGERIYDPTCGSGSLLLKCVDRLKYDEKTNDFSLYGQEITGATWALAKMNMFLHGMDNARIEWGDTINSPKLIEKDALMKFEVIVANPPFSLDKWGHENAGNDPYNRFHRGVPPKTKGDFAFITHMIESMTALSGRLAIVVPHGVLFRGSSEGQIRTKLIEENLLDAVIGLPPNLFFGTGIPAAILLFKKNKKDKSVFFIDASREFQDGKNQNILRSSDIEKIVATYKKRENVDKYACSASFEKIKDNDFNLNIPRYVDTFEEEEEIDINAVQAEINKLEAELVTVQAEMKKYLKELGYE